MPQSLRMLMRETADSGVPYLGDRDRFVLAAKVGGAGRDAVALVARLEALEANQWAPDRICAELVARPLDDVGDLVRVLRHRATNLTDHPPPGHQDWRPIEAARQHAANLLRTDGLSVDEVRALLEETYDGEPLRWALALVDERRP